MKHLSFIAVIITMGCLCVLFSCTKDVAKNPELAYSDKSLFDSCKNNLAFSYYKNNSSVIQVSPSSNSPHGAFKLKFNKIAGSALTDNGKLPLGKKFPEGSMVVKEVQSVGKYAFMYKHNNAWLWGEVFDNGGVDFSVYKDPTITCVNCHNQNGQRDLVVSFHFY